mmetsp:Transcript_60833/g.127482  ORF Transcript_60833/g.127482 Transcript_60833/m.127482 type:complete len:251 (-) Transcript_60833:1093-1845(-)
MDRSGALRLRAVRPRLRAGHQDLLRHLDLQLDHPAVRAPGRAAVHHHLLWPRHALRYWGLCPQLRVPLPGDTCGPQSPPRRPECAAPGAHGLLHHHARGQPAGLLLQGPRGPRRHARRQRLHVLHLLLDPHVQPHRRQLQLPHLSCHRCLLHLRLHLRLPPLLLRLHSDQDCSGPRGGRGGGPHERDAERPGRRPRLRSAGAVPGGQHGDAGQELRRVAGADLAAALARLPPRPRRRLPRPRDDSPCCPQ